MVGVTSVRKHSLQHVIERQTSGQVIFADE